ncbi:MAG TPA: 2OG-Fe(II) oxygenase [Saprospiraceae bacterium]|nr:2OG-Fe(II) oxygenase [Saprospiraceae bacterium]
MQFLAPAYQDLLEVARQNKDKYKNADPFPSAYFDNVFNPEVLDQVLAEFPDMEKGTDLHYNNPNENKYASRGEHRFGETSKMFAHFLNSQTFLEFLTELTGIDALIPDPYFEGGGFHQIKKGGFLKIHADFNKNKFTKLDRRLNVLVYLNKDWKEEYGGHFELWDKEMQHCVKKVLPVFNRMAMFSTTDYSWHGHPDPLNCPEGWSRKSLALYYYTNGRPKEEIDPFKKEHMTIFKERADGLDGNKMKNFNTLVNIVENVTPPIILKGVKKLFMKG